MDPERAVELIMSLTVSTPKHDLPRTVIEILTIAFRDFEASQFIKRGVLSFQLPAFPVFSDQSFHEKK